VHKDLHTGPERGRSHDAEADSRTLRPLDRRPAVFRAGAGVFPSMHQQ
ncbi:uncharacterized, partial [Tachysurus ichikawai]